MIRLDTCFIFFAYIRHHLCTFPSNAQYFHSQEVVVVYKTTYFFSGAPKRSPFAPEAPREKKTGNFSHVSGANPRTTHAPEASRKKKSCPIQPQIKGYPSRGRSYPWLLLLTAMIPGRSFLRLPGIQVSTGYAKRCGISMNNETS